MIRFGSVMIMNETLPKFSVISNVFRMSKQSRKIRHLNFLSSQSRLSATRKLKLEGDFDFAKVLRDCQICLQSKG